MEKLTLEDAYVAELMVNKINELIDTVTEMEERLSSRIDRHWAYHRMTAEKKPKIIPKEGVSNGQSPPANPEKEVQDKEVPKV